MLFLKLPVYHLHWVTIKKSLRQCVYHQTTSNIEAVGSPLHQSLYIKTNFSGATVLVTIAEQVC